jgi:aldehyde:ferredoxin oxidoreductase
MEETLTMEECMGEKIIRINMTTLASTLETVPKEWASLGGRGLTSTIVAANS